MYQKNGVYDIVTAEEEAGDIEIPVVEADEEEKAQSPGKLVK
jgi:hypothetical protein